MAAFLTQGSRAGGPGQSVGDGDQALGPDSWRLYARPPAQPLADSDIGVLTEGMT